MTKEDSSWDLMNDLTLSNLLSNLTHGISKGEFIVLSVKKKTIITQNSTTINHLKKPYTNRKFKGDSQTCERCLTKASDINTLQQ